MVYRLLKDVIAGRDVGSMSCSEARRLVSDFYDRLYHVTYGQRHPEKVDFLAEEALKKSGLGYFS